MIPLYLHEKDNVERVISTGLNWRPLDEPFTVPETGVYLVGITEDDKGFIEPTCYPDLNSAITAMVERTWA